MGFKSFVKVKEKKCLNIKINQHLHTTQNFLSYFRFERLMHRVILSQKVAKLRENADFNEEFGKFDISTLEIEN